MQPAPATFAGLFSALAGSSPSAPPAWTDNLQDDVAALSYERALQTHARYKATEPHQPSPVPETKRASDAEPAQTRERRTASVTIRMSQTEFAQLQARATEAGLSVSAYLRSCTLEAETLRSQVKEAIAELRSPTEASHQPERAISRWRRLLHRRVSH